MKGKYHGGYFRFIDMDILQRCIDAELTLMEISTLMHISIPTLRSKIKREHIAFRNVGSKRNADAISKANAFIQNQNGAW